MSRRVPRRGGGRPATTGLLLAACLGLAALIHFELEGRTTLSGVARSMPAAARGEAAGTRGRPAADVALPAPPAETGFDMPPLAMFSEIAARPLFAPSRRPPPPPEEAPAPEAPPPERGQFMLRGVALAGDQRVALLERRATGELIRAMEGQTIDGWRVTGIAAGEAVLEAGSDSYVIAVEKDVGPPAMPVSARAARADRRAAVLARLRGDPDADPEELLDEPLDPETEALLEEEALLLEAEAMRAADPDAAAAAEALRQRLNRR